MALADEYGRNRRVGLEMVSPQIFETGVENVDPHGVSLLAKSVRPDKVFVGRPAPVAARLTSAHHAPLPSRPVASLIARNRQRFSQCPLARTAAQPVLYSDAGVDIDAGNSLVQRIKPLARATRRPGADAELGGFGGLFDLKAAGFKRSDPRRRQ